MKIILYMVRGVIILFIAGVLLTECGVTEKFLPVKSLAEKYKEESSLSTEGANSENTEESPEDVSRTVDSCLNDLRDYKKVHIEKIVMTRTELSSGEFKTAYDMYFTSDIDLSSHTESSTLYREDENGVLKEDSGSTATVETVFGTDLSEAESAGDVFLEVTEREGYSTDFDYTGENGEVSDSSLGISYYYSEAQDAENALSDGMDGYEVIRTESSYMTETIDGETLVTTFISYAEFSKDGQTVIRTEYLKIAPGNESSCGSGCSCGHESMSGCGEECEGKCTE